MVVRREKSEKDVQQHNSELRELQRIIDHEKKLREFMNIKVLSTITKPIDLHTLLIHTTFSHVCTRILYSVIINRYMYSIKYSFTCARIVLSIVYMCPNSIKYSLHVPE